MGDAVSASAAGQQRRRRGQGRPRQISRRISRQPVGPQPPAAPPDPEMLRHFGMGAGEFVELKRAAEDSSRRVRAVLEDPATAPEAKHDAQCAPPLPTLPPPAALPRLSSPPPSPDDGSRGGARFSGLVV